MRPLRQLCKKISMIGKYIKYYFFSSLIFVSVFAFIYYRMNLEDPIRYSIGVFWGISNESPIEGVSFWSTTEVIVSQLFSIIIATSMLLKFLKPLNPIILSDKIAYNTKTKKFKFCYWIMWPEGRFLYDTTIRIFVTDRQAHQAGVNSLPVEWESKDEKVIKLRLARGIRYAQLSVKESKKLYNIINSKNNTTKDSANEYEIDLVISGSDSTGNRYYAWRRYGLNAVCYGYQFVPLQQHEYTDYRFFQGDEDKLNINVDKNKLKKELFRYQHFGKLYPLEKIEENEKSELKKYILEEYQLINGQYGPIRQKILDFYDWIIMFFLDKSHWKAWCKSVLPIKKTEKIEDNAEECLDHKEDGQEDSGDTEGSPKNIS